MAALAAQRDLLFGMLALQNGLIDQIQLVGAFQAWTRDKARRLAEHLVARGDLDAEQHSLLEGLVAQHLKKHGGDVEHSLAALSAGRSTRESLARLGDADVEASIAHLGAASTHLGEDAERTATYSVGSATSDGQRFRVLRPHARGGLGAVFVALDTELHREVALKQILDHHADDPVSRQRFLLEAEITGGLEHPGVVPVYGLGSYGDGRPYYAMRFIQGDSLKQAIERFHADERLTKDPGGRSLELRKLLRRFTDVCNAIAYAHSRGVLHRDIKPGNVIIGKYGETLVVDWGLAKAVGRADPGSTPDERTLVPSYSSSLAETLPGSALGTPAYMSPEQARGDLERLGPRSDVYSLGATLYCLLTGRPPYASDDVGVVLGAVQKGDFPAPRAVDTSIDPALKAVCLKAMALKPEDRYATPRVLADDLERWMADEPVGAWREPLARRLRRWSRRNRTAVTAASVALLAALLGLGAVAGVQAKANGELRSLNGRLERANAELADEKARVQERFDLAMQAIQTFHTGVSEDFLLREDKFKGLRDRLLSSAADFYGKLGALLKPRSDSDSRREMAKAEFELAELTAKVGDAKGALERHREVLALREALAAEPGADAESLAEVGRSLVALGRRQEAIGQTAEAMASYRAAQARLSELATAHPETPAYRAALTAAEYALGSLLQLAGRPAEALPWLERARDAREALAASDPSNTAVQSDLAASHYRIAYLLRDASRPAEALEHFRRALDIQQRLVDVSPSATRFRYELARSQDGLGRLLRTAGQEAEALANFARAQENYRRLAGDNPAVSSFQFGLVETYGQISELLRHAGRPAEALEMARRAAEVCRQVADGNPAVYEFQAELVRSYNSLGETQALLGRLPEALESSRQGLAVARNLVASNPEMTMSRFVLASALAGAGRTAAGLGRRADAAGSLREAIATLEAIPEPARHRSVRYNLACFHAMLAGVLAGSGPAAAGDVRAEGDRAMAALRDAGAHGFRWLSALRTDPDLDALRARPDFQSLMMDLEFPSDPFSKDTDADR